MAKTFSEWKTEIQEGIQRKKDKGEKLFILLQCRMTQTVANQLRDYFYGEGYEASFYSCQQCKKGLFDIRIEL